MSANPDGFVGLLFPIDPFGLVPMVRWFGNQKSFLTHQSPPTTANGSRWKGLGEPPSFHILVAKRFTTQTS